METLAFFLIALATAHGLAAAARAEATKVPAAEASEPPCLASPDSIRIADLETPGAERWLLHTDGTFCAPRRRELGETLELPRISE